MVMIKVHNHIALQRIGTLKSIHIIFFCSFRIIQSQYCLWISIMRIAFYFLLNIFHSFIYYCWFSKLSINWAIILNKLNAFFFMCICGLFSLTFFDLHPLHTGIYQLLRLLNLPFINFFSIARNDFFLLIWIGRIPIILHP